MTSVTRPEAVSQALAHWHRMVAQGDLSTLPSICMRRRCFVRPLRIRPTWRSGSGFNFKHGRQSIY